MEIETIKYNSRCKPLHTVAVLEIVKELHTEKKRHLRSYGAFDNLSLHLVLFLCTLSPIARSEFLNFQTEHAYILTLSTLISEGIFSELLSIYFYLMNN